MRPDAEWSRQAERGASFWVGVIAGIVKAVGWRAGRLLLPAITAWYYVASAPARAASREYLGRALDRPATAWDVFRHLFTFANAILERAYFVSGRTAAFRIEISGLEHVEALVAAGRGAVLLGGHFGSFEALRHLRHRCPVPVKALMYRRNAGPMTRLLETLDPALADGVIEIGTPGAMIAVHEAVAAGAFVGMLADRSPDGARSIPASFLGGVARFPGGPLIVAASLGCPVLTFCGTRLGPRQYRIAFTPFAERVVLERTTRQAALADHVQRYAAWLEGRCRAHPFNWFNFYPFWETAADARAPDPRARPLAGAGLPARGTGAGPGAVDAVAG